MPDNMFYLRVVCLALWLIVLAIKAPAFLRYVRGRSFTVIDEYRTGFFFTALVFVGSLGRWIFAPDNQSLFFGMYALTAALAVYVLLLNRQHRND